MKKGDVVMIYIDPMTEKGKEGRAELLECVSGRSDSCATEYWEVKFLTDGFVTHRFIKKKF